MASSSDEYQRQRDYYTAQPLLADVQEQIGSAFGFTVDQVESLCRSLGVEVFNLNDRVGGAFRGVGSPWNDQRMLESDRDRLFEAARLIKTRSPTDLPGLLRVLGRDSVASGDRLGSLCVESSGDGSWRLLLDYGSGSGLSVRWSR
jgi:hypothetical protein